MIAKGILLNATMNARSLFARSSIFPAYCNGRRRIKSEKIKFEKDETMGGKNSREYGAARIESVTDTRCATVLEA